MKVIKKDNFEREHINDVLICETESEYWAMLIAKTLNSQSTGDNQDWFEAVGDDYKLHVFSP